MKNNRIQTKRDTGKKSGFRLLHARTRGRKKQRAVAATPEDLGADVPNVGIGRALIVILVLHVVAIGAVFMHTSWTEGQQGNSFTSETPPSNGAGAGATEDEEDEQQPKQKVVKNDQGPKKKPKKNRLPKQKKPGQLAVTNQPRPLPEPEKVPAHSVIPEVAKNTPMDSFEKSIPKALEEPTVLVKPNTAIRVYKVKAGDTVWGICQKHKMSVDDFKALNGLTSNTIRVGQQFKVRTK